MANSINPDLPIIFIYPNFSLVAESIFKEGSSDTWMLTKG